MHAHTISLLALNTWRFGLRTVLQVRDPDLNVTIVRGVIMAETELCAYRLRMCLRTDPPIAGIQQTEQPFVLKCITGSFTCGLRVQPRVNCFKVLAHDTMSWRILVVAAVLIVAIVSIIIILIEVGLDVL
jgi:hypothetical protein